jgi:hypothetical protein
LAWSREAVAVDANDVRVIGGTAGNVTAVGFFGATYVLVQACTSAETQCTDAADDDCDGHYDCADPDCATDTACGAGGLCAGASFIACGQALTGTTFGRPANIDRYACTDWQLNGRETSYRYTALTTGAVTIALSGLRRDLDLIVLDQGAGGGCNSRNPGCRAASDTIGLGDESVTFNAEAGKTYYFVVDGYATNNSDFTLSVTCL